MKNIYRKRAAGRSYGRLYGGLDSHFKARFLSSCLNILNLPNSPAPSPLMHPTTARTGREGNQTSRGRGKDTTSQVVPRERILVLCLPRLHLQEQLFTTPELRRGGRHHMRGYTQEENHATKPSRNLAKLYVCATVTDSPL